VDSAWATVIGTLGGVIITAAAGLATAVITVRHQRAEAQRRDREASRRGLRDERRTVFVEFLSAYDAVFSCAVQIAGEVDAGARPRVAAPEVAEQLAFERDARAEIAAVRQAYLTLTITAGEKTREAADSCTESLWALGEAAYEGSNAARFRKAVEESGAPRQRLREAMRDELGIEAAPGSLAH
jgi:hypothetical protein